MLQKRLKSYYRQKKLDEENSVGSEQMNNHYYDHYVVIDFEATCDENSPDCYRYVDAYEKSGAFYSITVKFVRQNHVRVCFL